MAAIQQYKCPCCGGAVEFDSNSQGLKCPFCDSEFDIDTLNEAAEISDKVSAEDKMDGWNTEINSKWDENGATGAVSYICESCGGEIVGDASLGATLCPFCGNNVIINEKFSETLRPDLIIPFKLDKKAAKEALKKHLGKKKLLPKLFIEENHIDEIKGIYVPFWLFNADVEGGVKYSATKVRCWSTREYNYTETRYYDIYREGSVSFHDIPVDASSKMPDDLMDSLEPFDLSRAVDFNTAYFAGYFANKYDVTVDENIPRINVRVKHSTEDVFRNTVTDCYTTVRTDNSFIELKNGNAKYALLPVWLLNTTWNGQKYVFAMNGQSGKFVGNLPMDRKLYWKYWLIAFLVSIPLGFIAGYIVKFLFG